MKIKSIIVLLMVLSMIFTSFSVLPLNKVYASNPVLFVSAGQNETNAGFWKFVTPLTIQNTGDDIVFTYSMALRIGSAASEPSLSFTPSMTNACVRQTGHNEDAAGQTVTIMTCQSETAGNYAIELFETGNTCVGEGNPCGFAFWAAYELSGTGYGYTHTDGLGVYSNPNVVAHNSIAYNSTGFGIGVMALAEVTGKTAGAGFSIDQCQTYGGIYYYYCTQSENFASTSTTNFPYSTDGSGGGSTEGIIVFTLCSSTVTVQSTSYIATSTITSTTFTDLNVDYTGLWIIFLIFGLLAAMAILFIRTMHKDGQTSKE